MLSPFYMAYKQSFIPVMGSLMLNNSKEMCVIDNLYKYIKKEM
jgi:hypothetical protein